MTSTTWTSTTIATARPDFGATLMPALKKIGHFLAVCLGVHADTDSNFRGLDLNGNAMWASPTQR